MIGFHIFTSCFYYTYTCADQMVGVCHRVKIEILKSWSAQANAVASPNNFLLIWYNLHRAVFSMHLTEQKTPKRRFGQHNELPILQNTSNGAMNSCTCEDLSKTLSVIVIQEDHFSCLTVTRRYFKMEPLYQDMMFLLSYPDQHQGCRT